MITINSTSKSEETLWLTLLDLAESEENWTLVGARMVQLHMLERGEDLYRESLDADALAETRVKPSAVGRVSSFLKGKGFELEEPSAFGVGHRFVRGGVQIDVLAPEHVGGRAQPTKTTISPAHTVEVPGGRQALARTELVEVQVAGRSGLVPRPNLLGAILIKARAVNVDDVPESQRADLARLLSFVEDPDAIAVELRRKESSWLRNRHEMNDPSASCWAGLDEDARSRGLSALRILGEPRSHS